MKRREFIGLVGGAVAAWPLGARAQPRKIPRLAILLFNSPQIDSIGPLLEGLQGLGYVDGKSIAIEYPMLKARWSVCPIWPLSWFN